MLTNATPFYGIALLMLLGGCGSHRRLEEEKQAITVRTRRATGQQAPVSVSMLAEGLTKQAAIGMALERNESLQAAFAELGVARADLEKAGLYTNPYLDGIFGIPTNQSGPLNEIQVNNAAVFLGFKLSDLWMVPIKKRIADEELSLASLEVSSRILETIRNVSVAYDTCLAAQGQYDRAKRYHDQAERLLEGLPEGPLTLKLHNIKLEVIKWRSQYRLELIHLEYLLAGPPLEQVSLEGKLPSAEDITIPGQDAIDIALSTHPTLMIAKSHYTSAHHKLSFAYRNVMSDVNIGFNYQIDSTDNRSAGPFFHIAIPCFDPGHADIEKARSLILYQEKEYNAARRLLKEQALQTIEKLHLVREQILCYQSILRQNRKAHVNRSSTLANAPDSVLQQLASLEAQYQAEESYNKLQLTHAELIAQLNYLIGASIEKVHTPPHNVFSTPISEGIHS